LRAAVPGTQLAMSRAMAMVPSARVVLPLLTIFWLLVALAAFVGVMG
jgi:hypothetical protein